MERAILEGCRCWAFNAYTCNRILLDQSRRVASSRRRMRVYRIAWKARAGLAVLSSGARGLSDIEVG